MDEWIEAPVPTPVGPLVGRLTGADRPHRAQRTGSDVDADDSAAVRGSGCLHDAKKVGEKPYAPLHGTQAHTSMFEQFSRGYYLGRMYVEPRDGERAAMARDQHERVNEQLYTEGSGVERLDRPLVMKLENTHFPVHGDDGVAADTLAVPDVVLADTRVRNPPTLREVLLAKADHAERLLNLVGRSPEGTDASSGPAGI